MHPIVVNLWDDYAEEDLEKQHTYAYVAGDASEAQQKEVLGALLEAVVGWKEQSQSPLGAALAFHDSALIHPQLVGTDSEWCLYKRWEVKLQRLSHEDREALVDALNQQALVVEGRPVTVISES